MGRHSAPGDDVDVSADTQESAAAPPETAAVRRGRHSRGEDAEETGPLPGRPVRSADQRAAGQDEWPTQQIEPQIELPGLGVVEAEEFEQELLRPAKRSRAPKAPRSPKAAKPPKPPKPPKTQRARGHQSTAADLALLRRHADIRNRAVAGAVVPFVVYVVVLIALGARGVQYLIWLWVPMVVGGALAGLVLDAGHKRYASSPEA